MISYKFIENIQIYKWILIASFFSALTIISIKYYLIEENIYLLLITILSEIGLIYSYIQMFENYNLLIGFSLVKIISILIVLIPSILFLNVKLTNTKIVGLIFALVSIYLLA